LHYGIDVDSAAIVGHPDTDPISLFLSFDLDAPDIVLTRTRALFRAFDPVVDSVSDEMKERLFEGVYDPPVELRFACPDPHLDSFAE
jgi:hypothetical protein